LLNPITRRIFYFLLVIVVVLRHLNKPTLVMRLIFEHLRYSLGCAPPATDIPEKSLRKTVTIVSAGTDQDAADSMLPLRMGR